MSVVHILHERSEQDKGAKPPRAMNEKPTGNNGRSPACLFRERRYLILALQDDFQHTSRGVAQAGESAAFGTQMSEVQILSPRPIQLNSEAERKTDGVTR